jgi:tricorn protease
MLLRGMAGESLKLDVLRLASGNQAVTETEEEKVDKGIAVESLVTVPLTVNHVENLRYRSWEYKTQQLAEQLAAQAGFSVGYVHLESMSGSQAEDSFARGFFPNYNKDAFILDVRHNRGGNIDSWILDVLQRRPWMYWQSRDYDPTNGGIAWDEQFAFRGHIVVLIDEKTSSDGEGVSRGISELGLGRLIGSRTWGGGIWLSSDNRLVDGGIASVRFFFRPHRSLSAQILLCAHPLLAFHWFQAPEIGVYSDKFGWGGGIEQLGVNPDVEVDNNPRTSFDGKDAQLETAIAELKRWLEEEPIVLPRPPKHKKDKSMGPNECPAQ